MYPGLLLGIDERCDKSSHRIEYLEPRMPRGREFVAECYDIAGGIGVYFPEDGTIAHGGNFSEG